MKESKIFCPKCGKAHESEGVFCNYCGTNIESVLPESRRPKKLVIKQERTETPSLQKRIDNTFFCPKCRCENLRTNLECEICGEDFSKYDMIDSGEEFARIKEKKQPIKETLNLSPLMKVVAILATIAFIIALVFTIIIIIAFSTA